MAKIHSKVTVVLLNSVDISQYCNSVEFAREADTHETTGFGSSSKTYEGGLKDGTASLSGVYDSAVAGPRATIEPLLGTTVPLVYKPEGTGTGKPTKTVSVIVGSYKETSAVADMVTWSVDLQMTGDVVNTVGP